MKHIPPSLSNLKITELLVKLCAKMQLHSISSNIKPRLYFFFFISSKIHFIIPFFVCSSNQELPKINEFLSQTPSTSSNL